MNKNERIVELEKELALMRISRDFYRAECGRLTTFHDAVRRAGVTFESTHNPHRYRHSTACIEEALCQPDKTD